MKNLISILFTVLILTACKTAPVVKYSPPINGKPDPNGLVPAGEPLKIIDINWYAVLFYTTIILWAIWLYFRNEGGDDMDHDGIQDNSEIKSVVESHTDSKSVNNVGDGTSK